MRFFEFEAREVVKRAGIPVTDYGFTTDPAEARGIAERIGGPTVIKSQVLTGGRMKAGGVKFADTPEEAEEYARDILALEINGHMPRGVLVDPKAEVEQEYYAGVVWDGTRKQPVMIFSPVGGIDIEQVAEEQPDKVGRRHFSNILPLSDFQAKEVIASTGVTGSALNKLVPIVTRLARLFVENDMILAEINPLGRLADGSFVALDAHMDMENEARGRHRKLLAELGVGDEETRQAREARPSSSPARRSTPGPPRRGRERHRVRRQPRPGDRRRRRLADALRRRPRPRRQARQLLRDRREPLGREGLRPRQARAREARRRQDRGDDVDRLEHPRRHRRPRRDQSLHRARATTRPKRSPSSASPVPGRRRASRSSTSTGSTTPTARCRSTRPPAARSRRSREPAPDVHPDQRRDHLHRPGHHRPRGREPDPRVP